MNRLNLLTALTLTVAATLGSCDRNVVFDRYVPVSSEGWMREDTLSFGLRPVGSGGDYVEEIGLRANGRYPFANLTMVVVQTVHPSKATYTDTLSVRLVDEAGETMGRGVSVYQFRFPLRCVNLAPGDSLDVHIHHAMKRETLEGIVDVGMRVAGR